MLDALIFPPNVFRPEEASLLREATNKALDQLRVTMDLGEDDARRLAGDVILIARTGFSRKDDGLFDPNSLAEAAVARFLGVRPD
jgi:hypothetical protein